MSTKLGPGSESAKRTESFERFGAHVQAALGAGPDEQRLLTQRARLVEATTRRSARSSSWLSLLWERPAWAVSGLAVVAACVVFVALGVLGPGGSSGVGLTAELDGQHIDADSWVTANGSVRELRFSDASRIALSPKARARVVALDDQGLRMTLESGRVDAAITPGGPYRWVVVAGPYQVAVLGTVFSVDWSPEKHELSVDVTRGKVRVTDAEHEEAERVLVAGDSLRMTRPDAEDPAEPLASGDLDVLLPESSAIEPSFPARVQPPAKKRLAPRLEGAVLPEGDSVAEVTEEDAPVVPAPTPVEPSVPDWRQLAKAGRYPEALAAAKAGDLDGLIQSATPSDLLLLADTARLSGANALARRCLLTIRRRFPSHANATMAAYSLGRLEVDGGGTDRAAIKWFKTYLQNAPSGALAEAARGRILLSYRKLGDRSSMRQAAKDYLRHHPSGGHASLAKSLLDD